MNCNICGDHQINYPCDQHTPRCEICFAYILGNGCVICHGIEIVPEEYSVANFIKRHKKGGR